MGEFGGRHARQWPTSAACRSPFAHAGPDGGKTRQETIIKKDQRRVLNHLSSAGVFTARTTSIRSVESEIAPAADGSAKCLDRRR